VELILSNFAKLRENRKNELPVVHAGVCDVEREVHFVESNASNVGGIVEIAEQSFQDQWWNERWGYKVHPPILCTPLRNIVSKHIGETA